MYISYKLLKYYFSFSLDSSRYGQSTLERETQRNTQLNKFSEFSPDSFNRHLDRLVDERDSDTYTSRVSL